jgi:hypothetical protein
MTKEEVNFKFENIYTPPFFCSQSSEQHVDRVLKLAEELIQNGIDVKIDK